MDELETADEEAGPLRELNWLRLLLLLDDVAKDDEDGETACRWASIELAGVEGGELSCLASSDSIESNWW